MRDNRERKSNLITVRIDDDDRELLDYLSDHTGRSMSDTIVRACRFYSSSGGFDMDISDNVRKRVRKNVYVHMRVTDSDLGFLNDVCSRLDISISQLVRHAIRGYYTSMSGVY